MDEEEVGTVQDKDPRYPIQVLYCAVCGMPPELCEYNTPQDFERCKPWLAVNVPEMYPDLKLSEIDGSLAESLADAKISKSSVKDGKESKRKKRVAIEPEIVIQKSARKGRKQVTIVYGLDLFGMKIPEVAKVCKKKFSCGASAVKAPDQRDTLEIQGDRMRTMAAFLRDDFKVPEGRIFVVDEDKAKVPAFDVVAESAG
mmetsp:Transcript_9088/g.13268  ORF Transcript_9088/g.13268 Transcript_9088/m.13268 type:complete len:200 (-) Transcript_9088:1131-1730(-)